MSGKILSHVFSKYSFSVTSFTLSFVALVIGIILYKDDLLQPQTYAQTNESTVTYKISAKENDAEENIVTGGVNHSSVDLELIHDDDAADQQIGMRFTNVNIPKGAFIQTAYLIMKADASDTTATNLTFFAEAADNASVFTTAKNNISLRKKTTAKVEWLAIPSWKSGSIYQTPNIAPLIQEVITRSGWQSGNALSILVTGKGQRVAKSYNKSAVDAPHVKITYVMNSSLPTPTMIPLPSSTPTPLATATPTIAPPSPTPTATATATVPAQVLNLSNWKLTLPIGTAESPTEILQPQLATYMIDPWFIVQNGAVRFRAPVNAPTTSGSSYPRSELREMKNSGKEKASWSSTIGIHSMTIDQAITAVPATKRHVVAGQIHDASDDVIVIRLEYPKLSVNVDGSNAYLLDGNYVLGKRFTVRFDVSGGETKVYYNGTLSYTLAKAYTGAYFKAGAYTQSNCSREAAHLCLNSNFGEVVIYSLQVSHQ